MSLDDILSGEDLATINKSQALREQIVTELTKEGIPTNKNDRDFLLETLKDSDKSIFTKSRLKVANKSADNDRATNSLIAGLLSKHVVGSSNRRQDIPELDQHIRPDNVVDGEKDIGLNTMSYDQFVK